MRRDAVAQDVDRSHEQAGYGIGRVPVASSCAGLSAVCYANCR